MLSSAQGFIEFLIKQNLASFILQLKLYVVMHLRGAKINIFLHEQKSGQV